MIPLYFTDICIDVSELENSIIYKLYEFTYVNLCIMQTLLYRKIKKWLKIFLLQFSFTGMAGILVMGAGIFASGTFMRTFKPNARFVAKWIAASALAYSIGMVILMWLGCPLNDFVGLNDSG